MCRAAVLAISQSARIGKGDGARIDLIITKYAMLELLDLHKQATLTKETILNRFYASRLIRN